MKQFKAREVTKRYVALVQGLPPAKLSIENQLGRDPHNRKKQAVLSEGGRHAHSIIMLKEPLAGSALVEVDIKTGRTHQIRFIWRMRDIRLWVTPCMEASNAYRFRRRDRCCMPLIFHSHTH